MTISSERPAWQTNSVDDYGRDSRLVAAISPLVRLRWNVSVTGADNVPTAGGALLVCNTMRFSLNAIYAAQALGQRSGRPVRLVGRPDTAPVGAFMRRCGVLLAHPDEVLGALRDDELVLVAAAGTRHAFRAGAVPEPLIGQALVADTPVLPTTTVGGTRGRNAHVAVGQPVSLQPTRKGPLASIELAEHIQLVLQRMLDAARAEHEAA